MPDSLETMGRRVVRAMRQAALAAALAAATIALLLSLPLVSDFLIERLQVFPPITREQRADAAHGPPCAIVILSAGRRAYAPEFGAETVDGLSLERVRYGARLVRQTGLPVLVSGGSLGPKEPSISYLMADALVGDYDVHPRWLEVRSLNTAENAIFSADILKRAGIRRVILVTHAWHMPRARAAFEANGITVIPAPTAFYVPTRMTLWEKFVPSMTAFRMSGYAIHEIIGSGWYAMRYGYR